MPKELKEEIRDLLEERAKEIGIPNFLDLVATEEEAETEEEVLEWIQKVKHPALEMEPMM